MTANAYLEYNIGTNFCPSIKIMKSIALLSLRNSLLPERKFLLYQRTAERINLNPVRVQKNSLQYVISISQLLEAMSYRLFFTFLITFLFY